MSILITGPLNFSVDVMKWGLTDVSWKWQHVSLLPGWRSLLVYRCVAWCTHRMARCHLIKYHSCFDREALIESLVSFIKLCVIIVWNFFPRFSLALMEYACSWILLKQKRRENAGSKKRNVMNNTMAERETKNKSKSERQKERERGEIATQWKSLCRVSCDWIHNSGSWF